MTTSSNPHICEVVDQKPWHCGHSDGCEQGWHLATYWIDGDGYTVDEFSDGDHEVIESLPEPEESRTAWSEYYQHVAQTGEDPLGQISVPRVRREVQVWQVDVLNSICGARIAHYRRSGRGQWLPAPDMPKQLRQYLAVGESGDCRTHARVLYPGAERMRFADYVALADSDPMVRVTRRGSMEARFLIRLEVDVPRADRAVERELRRAARQAIAREEATA